MRRADVIRNISSFSGFGPFFILEEEESAREVVSQMFVSLDSRIQIIVINAKGNSLEQKTFFSVFVCAQSKIRYQN